MATVADKQDPAARYGAAVDGQLAQATTRIRVHDLTLGGLTLAALVLAYAAGMMLLDQAAVLPEWVRQLALGGFAVTVLAVGYLTIVRPLRRRVNPLYAALKVERTIDDAKNTLSGYVDARDRADVRADVRAAIGARAVAAAGEADLNRAVDHRGLLYVGGAAVALGLVLVVLFFLFRPAQFGSLLGRAFVPFTSDPIVSRTRITLTEPDGGNVTVTAGQSVTVKVTVSGKVPAADRPDRLRVLYRHAADAAEYEELPLDPGETSRDWQVRLPDTVVRNGLWYKVAGGDGETPEYKVSVRSVPRFTGFEVAYEYPRYVRRAPETTTDPHLEAYRGTRVTITGTTNRPVKDGRLTFDPAQEPVAGVPVPGHPDRLRFTFVVTAGGSYRAAFTGTDGERNPDPPPFALKLISDAPPQLELLKPEEDEVKIPANGQLAVDGRVGDDFGIDTVTLRMKVVEPAEKPLTAKPFNGGKSFRREADGTWPRSLDTKDSVDLANLTDDKGQPVPLADGVVIEYWLEATDNRTKPGPAGGAEPDPQVGRSKVKRVRVTPPVVEPEQQAQNDARKERRKNEEQRFNQEQGDKLNQEERKLDQPPPKPQDGKEPEKQPQDGKEPEKKDEKPPHDKNDSKDDPNPAKDSEGVKKDGTPEKKEGDGTEPKTPEAPMPKEKGKDGDPPPMPKNDGMPPPKDDGQPKSGNDAGGKQPDPAPMPRSKDDRNLQEKANKVQEAIDRNAETGGQTKPNQPAEEPPADPTAPKPEPKADAGPGDAPPKPQPEAGMPPAEPKPNADAKPEPKDGEQPKPDPKADPMGGAGGEPKPQPKDGPGGGDKPAPKPQPKDNGDMPPMPGAENPSKEPAGGGTSKPAGGNQPKQQDGGKEPDPKGGEAAQPKPQPGDPAPKGQDKPTPKDGTGDPAGQPDTGATSKPGTPPTAKPQPKDDTAPMPGGKDGDQPKPAPGMNDPSPPGEPKPAPKDGPKGPNDATAQKPQPGADKPQPKAGGDPTAKGANQKPDPKQQAEVEQALKDLTNPDPKKQQEARDKLDKTVGKDNRQKAEEIAKGLQSDKPEERAAAKEKLDQMRKDAERQAGKGADPKQPQEKDATAQGPKEPGKGGDKIDGKKVDGKKDNAGTAQAPKVDPKELEKAARDLNSPDPKKQQQARDKLDKMVGPDARKEAEQLAKDLKSDDPATREAAEKKLEAMKEAMKKEADRQANQGGPADKKENGKGGDPKAKDATAQKPKVDPKEVDKALDEMANGDPKAQQAAKDKLDKMLGEGAGKKAEKAIKDQQQTDDPLRRQAGAKAENDLRKMAEDLAKGNKPADAPGKELTQAEREELAKQLKNLNAPDPKDRKAAEEAIDKAVGKEDREKLQEAMNDPRKRDALQQELERLAQNRPRGGDRDQPRGREAGPDSTPVNPEALADAKNRLRAGELQLEKFERNKGNKDVLDQTGMTPAEYDDLLDKLRANLAGIKREVADLEKDDRPRPAVPAENVGSSAKLETRKGGPGTAGVAGPATAAPGYTDAMKAFREGAVKVKPKP